MCSGQAPRPKEPEDDLFTAPMPCVASQELGAGARFAAELFCPTALRSQNRADVATLLGDTTCVQRTRKLESDFNRLVDGGAIYCPGCLSTVDDLSLFRGLYEELSPWHASPYKRAWDV